MEIERIETSRVVLRKWVMEDAEALLKYASDYRVADPGLWTAHRSIEESRLVLRELFMPYPMIYAIVLKETDEPVGCIGLVPEGAEHYDVGATGREIGYWIGYPYWGKGLMSEALGAFVRHCKDVGSVCSLVITTSEGNIGSQRVAEKCGFEKMGECVCEGVPSLAYRLEL